VAEELVLEEDLVDDLLRAADDERASAGAQGVEGRPLHRRPAALAADRGHHLGVGREELCRRPLGRIRDVPVGVDRQRQPPVPGRGARPAMQLGKRHEALRLAADDRKRHRQPEPARTRRRLRIAAHSDPDGQRLLHRARIHDGVGERRAVHARPRDRRVAAQLEQQPELLREELVVVGEVVAEERERLDERAAARHDLGASTGEQVDRRELLEDADRIVRAQDRDGAREADARRAHGCRREDDRRCGDGEVGAVMLADAEDV
jgi:hypothetical protein